MIKVYTPSVFRDNLSFESILAPIQRFFFHKNLLSYAKVEELIRPIGPSNKIDRVSKFDNSLSFGARQNALFQIFL